MSPLHDDEFELISHDSLSRTASYNTPDKPHRKRPGPTQWALALLPLIAHLVLATCTAAFVYYIRGRTFGVSERRASFVESDGRHGRLKRLTFLQTDITTLLSVVLALTRTCGGAWCVAMCSRSAFLLLENDGMRLKDLTWMLHWGLPASFTSHRAGSHSRTPLITALVLLASLPAQLAAPVLTGSITWRPNDSLVLGDVPVSNISTSANGQDSFSWGWYHFAGNKNICRTRAAGLASTAWSADAASSLGIMKRIVAPAKRLSANSTLNNITLPYFFLHSVDWLNINISQITRPNLTAAIDVNGRLKGVGSSLQQVVPTLAIIPDGDQDPSAERLAFPEATKVEKKASILALFANREDNSTNCTSFLSDAFGVLPINRTDAFLPSTWTQPHATAVNCYIFANITYSAGAALCKNCSITPGGILTSNISKLELQEDLMTTVALSMMPEVIKSMAEMNISIPLTRDNLNTYTQEMLTRSYAASWTVITNVIGSSFAHPWAQLPYASGSLQTPAKIAVPDILAAVALWRVGLWYGLQLVVTFSGVVFIGLQMTSRKGLVVEPALEWFLLDTREITRRMDFTSPRGKDRTMRFTGEDFLTIRYER